ncbi:MAG: hypothetical protein RL205_1114 [Actinomycetota bacterium]
MVTGIGWMPWRYALWMAAGAAVLWLVLRMFPRTKSASWLFRETSLIMVLYALWQYVGSLDFADYSHGDEAGLWLAQLESTLHWPSEAWIQAPVLGHELAMKIADSYYASLHIPVFIITLIWVLVFHRRDWNFVRTTTAILTGACLVIQFIPVAPPRLLPSLNIVDTAQLTGLSVYQAIPGANQFAAMPSVHCGWAAAVAFFIIVVARSPWRWLAVIYPIATLWVVVVTGNHFIIDGVVAYLLLAAAAGITCLFPSQRPVRWSSDKGPKEDVPALDEVLSPHDGVGSVSP